MEPTVKTLNGPHDFKNMKNKMHEHMQSIPEFHVARHRTSLDQERDMFQHPSLAQMSWISFEHLIRSNLVDLSMPYTLKLGYSCLLITKNTILTF